MTQEQVGARYRALDDQERRARSLLVCCRSVGDRRGTREARRDLASLQRARRVLRSRQALAVLLSHIAEEAQRVSEGAGRCAA